MNDDETHQDAYERGLAKRRSVLGDAYVDKALGQATAFGLPLQRLVTEYCWGMVWSRDGLPDKTRSLVNLGILTALNRSHELATHVRGALRNGATPEEIQEILLQTAIYVGVPAAMESFRVAEKVVKEYDVESAD